MIKPRSWSIMSGLQQRAYEEGREAGRKEAEQERSDCEYPPMWVVLKTISDFDSYQPDMFVSLHGSEFAADSEVTKLEAALDEYGIKYERYEVREVSVESV